ncbi:MAG TPA: hypothetical protein VIK38_00805 [Coriobacteriia bacterium]
MTTQHPNVYWTADRSALVEEGDVRAAFLAYAAADPIPDAHLELLVRKARPTPEQTTETAAPKRAARPRAARKPKA